MSLPFERCQLPTSTASKVMPLHIDSANTSSKSFERVIAASLDKMPCNITALPAPPARLHNSKAAKVPDQVSLEPTKVLVPPKLAESAGIRLTYTIGMPAALAILVICGVAAALTAVTTRASTPEAMKFCTWLNWVPTSSRASSIWKV